MAKTALSTAKPISGVRIQGDLAFGAVLYARLRFVGDLMQLGFPTSAEIAFSKFPLDVR